MVYYIFLDKHAYLIFQKRQYVLQHFSELYQYHRSLYSICWTFDWSKDSEIRIINLQYYGYSFLEIQIVHNKFRPFLTVAIPLYETAYKSLHEDSWNPFFLTKKCNRKVFFQDRKFFILIQIRIRIRIQGKNLFYFNFLLTIFMFSKKNLISNV